MLKTVLQSVGTKASQSRWSKPDPRQNERFWNTGRSSFSVTATLLAALAVSATALPEAALAGEEKYFAGDPVESDDAFSGFVRRQREAEDNKYFAGDSEPLAAENSAPKAVRAAPAPEPVANPTVTAKTAQRARQKIAREESPLPFIDEDVTTVANAPKPAPRPVQSVARKKAPKRGTGGQSVDPIKTAAVSKCLKPSQTNDRDIKHNAKSLAGACIQRHTVKDGKRTWTIYQIGSGGAPHYPILHDDEHAAFSAAARVSGGKRGTIWAVEAGERRMYKGQDPNRNFGSGKCRNQRGSNGAFSRFLMGKMRSGRIIAVHSNANSFAGGGGSGNISVRRKSAILQGFPSKKAKGGFRDEDNFILVPGRSAKPKGRALSKIRRYNNRGINAMYEYVRGRGDCSLSNYLALKGQSGRYANVEVQDGQTNMAVRLIKSAR